MSHRELDLSNLGVLFKGDSSLVREWIGLYLQESPKYFALLTESHTNGDARALASAAHDLQPQAHYLGDARLLELLAAIEDRAVNGDTPACAPLLELLMPVREAIEAELRAALDAG